MRGEPTGPRYGAELAAFATVVAATLARFGGALVATGHPSDEAHYFAGFARYAAGLDPYALRDVLFPPSFGGFGALLVAVAGERGAALLLRGLSALGIAATAWFAAAATERSLRHRLALGIGGVLLAPPFAHAVYFGNAGPIAAGLALAALALAPRRPLAGGALLGLSLALKPVAAALAPLLAVRPHGKGRGPLARRGLLAAGTATALAAALVLAAGPGLLPRFLARHAELWRAPFQLGFVRAAAEVGVALPTWVPFAAVIAVAALWLRRAEPGDRLFATLAPAIALLAAPIVWLHTLALALPVQLRALFGPKAFRSGLRRPLEVALRWSLAAAIWGAGGVGAIEAAPAPFRAAVAALPLVAVAVLAARCIADDAATGPVR